MSLVSCKEFKRTGSVDDSGHRTWVRSFKVITDDPNDGPYLVMTAPGIVYNDPYNLGGGEVDLFAYARDFKANPYDINNSRTFWQVDVTYSSKPVPNQFPATTGLTPPTSSAPPTPPGSQSPPDRNWTVTYGTIKVQTPMWYDKGPTKKRVICSNNLLYPSPIYTEHNVTTITIGAWYAPSAYDLKAKRATFIGSVNDATWQGYDAGIVKCEDLTGEYLYEQDDWWLKVQLVVHVAAPTMLMHVDYPGWLDLAPGTEQVSWDVEVVNAGLKELVSGEHYTILDKNNKPVAEPFPLTFAGAKATSGNFTYRRYRANPWKDWTSIL